MRNSKARIAAIAIVTVILVGGGGAAAIAYWSTGGSGSGSAATGTNANITAVQTSVIAGLAPGVAAQTLSGTFTNTNTSPSYVTSVTASIGTVTKAGGAPAGTCDSTDYTLSNTVMSVGAEIPVGTSQGNWTGATIAFNDKGTNQDACKGATVGIVYAIS